MDQLLIIRYFHFIGIFLVVAALFFEAIVISDELSPKKLKLLAKIDGLYGLGAILTTLMGLWMWLGEIGKPADFYSNNWIFNLKFTLFILVGLLSLYPTIFFVRNAKSQLAIKVPKMIKLLIYIELAIVFSIPLLAVLMARGIDSLL